MQGDAVSERVSRSHFFFLLSSFPPGKKNKANKRTSHDLFPWPILSRYRFAVLARVFLGSKK